MATEVAIQLIKDLSARLSVMHEISYLPEDVELIDPIGTNALRKSLAFLTSTGASIPSELYHWINKLNETRPH